MSSRGVVQVDWQDSNITQHVRLVITWKRDPVTNRKPFSIEGRWPHHQSYYDFHEYIAGRYNVDIHYLIVKKNG